MSSSGSAHSNISFSLASNKGRSRKTLSKLGYEEVYQEDYNEQEFEDLTKHQRKTVEKLQQLRTNIYDFLEERLGNILPTKGK